MNKLRVNDRVKVLSGDDKGKIGKILSIDHKAGLVVVEGVFITKKHNKPTNEHPEGSISEGPRPVSLSKVALVDKKDKVVKVKIVTDDKGKKTRVNRKTQGKI